MNPESGRFAVVFCVAEIRFAAMNQAEYSAPDKISLVESTRAPVIKRYKRKNETVRLGALHLACVDQEWPWASFRVVRVMTGCLRTYSTEAQDDQGMLAAVSSNRSAARYGKRS
jgi:hypothetical protein